MKTAEEELQEACQAMLDFFDDDGYEQKGANIVVSIDLLDYFKQIASALKEIECNRIDRIIQEKYAKKI